MSVDAQGDASQPLVAGKYRLSRLLGQGGMGSVWEGVHETLGTRVAVKFIEAEYADSHEARQRFENEAKAAAHLRSKHVVQVYDHGVTDDGRPYIVMEYLAGEPLDDRLERVGRLSGEETARIMMQVCRALARAHDVGIVHRDLKPENVFLVWDEEDQADVVKVVDFGIAKFTDRSLGVSSSTRTGSVLGTPYYMSPEQARGLKIVDHRSDLWSLGVIAYRCIVGRLPFEGESMGDLLVKICTGPVPVPTQQAGDVPPGFDTWFAQALSREPDQRFASAREFAEQLCVACGVAVRRQMPSSALGPMDAAPAGAQATPLNAWTDSSAAGVVAGAAQQQAPAQGETAGPVTHTPGLPSARSKLGGGVAAAVAGLVVLGIGVAVAAKMLGGAPAEAEADAGLGPSAASAPPVQLQPEGLDLPESVDDAPQPESEKNDEAKEAEDAEAADSEKALSDEAKEQAAQQAKPKVPVRRAAPRPKPKPKPKPQPKPEPSQPSEIDVGY